MYVCPVPQPVWGRHVPLTPKPLRAGKGVFNNAFKVADDIRQLGAVPEEDEETREVSVDKHMAQAMEERLLRGFEQEMIRDRQAMIKSIMRDGTGACAACCVLCALRAERPRAGVCRCMSWSFLPPE